MGELRLGFGITEGFESCGGISSECACASDEENKLRIWKRGLPIYRSRDDAGAGCWSYILSGAGVLELCLFWSCVRNDPVPTALLAYTWCSAPSRTPTPEGTLAVLVKVRKSTVPGVDPIYSLYIPV